MILPIFIIARPTWGPSVEKTIRTAGYDPHYIESREGYVNRLTDTHAAMVLVDASQPDWGWWANTAKASPATRRIPIVAVSESQPPVGQGADLHLTPSEISAKIIQKYARAQTETERTELNNQCAEPLPPRAQQAIELFNSSEYYKQHDLLEELWMEEEGPVRDLYRAILQVGVAYYQVQQGNTRGAYKMLLRVVQWLAILPDECQGVNIAQLRTDASALRSAIEAGEEDLSQYLTTVHLT